MLYRVLAALDRHLDSGFVWTNDPRVHGRSLIRILNPETGKSIYCEALRADKNFMAQYASGNTFQPSPTTPFIVINGWYRANLEIDETNADINLSIELCKGFLAQIRAGLAHPQVIARIATILGLTGVLLGVLGLIVGVISLIVA